MQKFTNNGSLKSNIPKMINEDEHKNTHASDSCLNSVLNEKDKKSAFSSHNSSLFPLSLVPQKFADSFHCSFESLDFTFIPVNMLIEELSLISSLTISFLCLARVG
jgi:hypothetical protein